MERKQAESPVPNRPNHIIHIEYASPNLRDIELYKEMVIPDERSSVFNYTPAGLEQDLNTIRPSQKLPKDIAAMLKVTRELYAHAYLNYDFFRVAEVHCFLTMEAALKVALGYTDHRKYPEKSKWTLGPLLSAARKKGLLSDRVEPYVKLLVQLRNDCCHPRNHTIINAAMAIVPYLRAVDVVNCVFDEHYRKAPEPAAFVAQREYGRELKRQLDATRRSPRGP